METVSEKAESNSVQEAYQKYRLHGCSHSFASESFEWMMQYSRRLNRDPDICQDFLLQFVEKLPRFLHSFKRRPVKSFTGYLARCMRFDFMNYVRKTKRYQHKSCEVPVESFSHFQDATTHWHTPLAMILSQIRPRRRVPMKLQAGWPLQLADLRHLCAEHGAQRARELLTEYNKKLNNLENWKSRHRRKMSLYFDRILRGNYNRDYRTIRRRMERERTANTAPVMSLREIAGFLGISKAAIHRRIGMGRRALRAGLEQWQGQETRGPGSLDAGFLGSPGPALLYEFCAVGDRHYLLLEPVKNVEPVGISLYSQNKVCYKLGLSGALAFPLHLYAPGEYVLKTTGQALRFKLSV